MKTLLCTGALGLTGTACVELFLKKGWKVVGIDNNQRAAMYGTEEQDPPSHYDFRAVDIRDAGEINKLFSKVKFDAIIHAAAQPSHDYATDHAIEDFQINAFGTLNLLEATRHFCPEATFVYVSTDKVYGENMHDSLIERETRYDCLSYTMGFDEMLGLDFAGDRSLFGCSKAAADMYVQVYGAKFGMKTVCFRPGCITGKNHKGAEMHGFLAYLAKCIKEGRTYKVHGNGKQVRDQIHATDLAEAFYQFIQAPKAGAVYNMGGGSERSVSLLEAVDLIEKETGKKAILEFGTPHRKGDRLWDVHDVSKFRSDYSHWEYSYSLHDIIKDLSI